METVAVAIICKTPSPGRSKTRLSPPLQPEECAEISGCFIRDLAATIAAVAQDGPIRGYALYSGSRSELRQLLPDPFPMLPQCEGDLGQRLNQGIIDLLARVHRGAIIVNSDSPTLPPKMLQDAAAALLCSDAMVIGPAIDGGYTMIGLTRPHPELFAAMPWSTSAVYQNTLERARAIDLPAISLDRWYDVDDAASYAMLEAELRGIRPPFAALHATIHDAPHTRMFLKRRQHAAAVA